MYILFVLNHHIPISLKAMLEINKLLLTLGYSSVGKSISCFSFTSKLHFCTNFNMNNFSALLGMRCNKLNHCEETGYYNCYYKLRLKVPSSVLALIPIKKPFFTLVAIIIRK